MKLQPAGTSGQACRPAPRSTPSTRRHPALLFALAALPALVLPLRADPGEHFLQALQRRDIGQARALFLRYQNEASKALEKALATGSAARVGRYLGAVDRLQRELRNAAPGEIAGTRTAVLAAIYSHKEKGWRARRSGRWHSARQHFLAALHAAEAGSSRWQQQHIAFLIAYTYADEGRFGESNDWLLRSWKLAVPGRMTHLDAMIQENLGHNAQKLGDFQPALESYHWALQLHSAIEYPEGIATAANNLATLYQESGNEAAALTYFRRCLAALQTGNRNVPIVENNIASCLLELKKAAEAKPILDKEVPAGSAPYFQRLGLRQRYLRSLGREDQAAALARQALMEARETGNSEFISDALRNALLTSHSSAAASRLVAEVLPLLPPADPNHWLTYLLLGQIYQRQGNSRGVEECARKALLHLRRQKLGTDFEFNFSGNVLEVVRLWSWALVQERKFEQGLTVWEKGRALARGMAAPSWRRFQQSLGPECAVIDFCVTEAGTIAWVVRRHTVQCFLLRIPETTLESEVESLLAPFANPSNILAPLFDQRRANALYRALIEPLEGSLQGATCWTLLPDGKLHALPFEMLESSGRTPLLERAAIRYWNGLQEISGAPRTLHRLTAWVDGAIDDSSLLPAGTRVVRTWDDVRRSQGDTLHYAGHSLLDQTFPALSTMAPHSAVSARNIARSSLSYRLVVLNSCESAGGISGFGAGLVGLSAAFQTAGARQVIATLWPIDQHSSLLLGELYKAPLQESRLAHSLRRARLQFRRESFRVGAYTVSMSSPYFWAPYVLISPHYRHPSRQEGALLPFLVPLAGLTARYCIGKRRRPKR